MSARSIARELAVIVLPQLPKDKAKLDKVELKTLIAKSVSLLVDNAKQNLADANALLLKAAGEISDTEVEHPDNQDKIEELQPVNVTTQQLRNQVELIERALQLTAEALDIPEIILLTGGKSIAVPCKKCKTTSTIHIARDEETEIMQFFMLLIETLNEHKEEIDNFLQQAKAKWRVERMVSIDRDILRLACAEALYLHDVPINVCISEAVELSHRFADERAAKFINGVLGDLSATASHFRRTGEFKSLEEIEPATEAEATL
jgi:transcription antitermination factor NusB